MSGNERSVSNSFSSIDLDKQAEDRNTRQFKATLNFLLGNPYDSKSKLNVNNSIDYLHQTYAELKALQKELANIKKFSENNVDFRTVPEEEHGKSYMETLQDGIRDKMTELNNLHEYLNKLAEACEKVEKDAPASKKSGIISKLLDAIGNAFTVSGDASMALQAARIRAEIKASPKDGADRKFLQKVGDLLSKAIIAIASTISNAAVKIKAYIQNTELDTGKGYRDTVNEEMREGVKKAFTRKPK